jgi:hypothetical protein
MGSRGTWNHDIAVLEKNNSVGEEMDIIGYQTKTIRLMISIQTYFK